MTRIEGNLKWLMGRERRKNLGDISAGILAMKAVSKKKGGTYGGLMGEEI